MFLINGLVNDNNTGSPNSAKVLFVQIFNPSYESVLANRIKIAKFVC